jgi:hypothetical protein
LFCNRKTKSLNPPRPAGGYILHLILYRRLTTEGSLFEIRRIGLPVQGNWQCDPQTRTIFAMSTYWYTAACLFV